MRSGQELIGLPFLEFAPLSAGRHAYTYAGISVWNSRTDALATLEMAADRNEFKVLAGPETFSARPPRLFDTDAKSSKKLFVLRAARSGLRKGSLR
jgi:hypothetical protein